MVITCSDQSHFDGYVWYTWYHYPTKTLNSSYFVHTLSFITNKFCAVHIVLQYIIISTYFSDLLHTVLA